MSFFVAKTQHLTLQYEMLYKLKATRLGVQTWLMIKN